MNKEEIKKKLVALEANVDAVLFRRNMYGEEDQQDQGMGVGTALKAGALAGAAGAGGYGAYLGDRSIMRKYGMMTGGNRVEAYRNAAKDALWTAQNSLAPKFSAAKQAMGTAYNNAAEKAASVGTNVGSKITSAYGSAAENIASKAASVGSKLESGLAKGALAGRGLLGKFGRILGKGVRVATAGKFGWEAVHDRLTQLSAQIELATPLAEYKQAHRDAYYDAKAKKRELRKAYKDARNELVAIKKGYSDSLAPMQEKLHKDSYWLRGGGIGALAGGATGAILTRSPLGAVGGALVGVNTGGSIGARIRRKRIETPAA